jgi:hypothetical protein
MTAVSILLSTLSFFVVKQAWHSSAQISWPFTAAALSARTIKKDWTSTREHKDKPFSAEEWLAGEWLAGEWLAGEWLAEEWLAEEWLAEEWLAGE